MDMFARACPPNGCAPMDWQRSLRGAGWDGWGQPRSPRAAAVTAGSCGQPRAPRAAVTRSPRAAGAASHGGSPAISMELSFLRQRRHSKHHAERQSPAWDKNGAG
jgi:hypothetical protein